MVGAPAIDERKNSTNLTMTFPAQLKPELRTRLARIFLELDVQDEKWRSLDPKGGVHEVFTFRSATHRQIPKWSPQILVIVKVVCVAVSSVQKYTGT